MCVCVCMCMCSSRQLLNNACLISAELINNRLVGKKLNTTATTPRNYAVLTSHNSPYTLSQYFTFIKFSVFHSGFDVWLFYELLFLFGFLFYILIHIFDFFAAAIAVC